MQQGPADFVRWLAALPANRGVCVECGAGQAELSSSLKSHFQQVIAIDASPPIASRQLYPVQQGLAEALPVATRSVDLLFSMQAAHHFNLDLHVREAARITRPGGIFAMFSWGAIDLPQPVKLAYEPVFVAVSRFWEPDRDWVVSGYNGFEFPGLPIEVPPFYLTKWFTPEDLETEMASWSAVQAASKYDVEFPEPRLNAFRVDEQTRFECRWRIVGQVFRC
ncbi:class I SAM-dependent methyltransferase [Hoeflea sp.]|uniref:class I SAM-dependent methyltransferase n=1 Tax=Hoeflea sp. TaxID=1940281 RepID=UPI003B014A66